jgi:hypothetical protein
MECIFGVGNWGKFKHFLGGILIWKFRKIFKGILSNFLWKIKFEVFFNKIIGWKIRKILSEF